MLLQTRVFIVVIAQRKSRDRHLRMTGRELKTVRAVTVMVALHIS